MLRAAAIAPCLFLFVCSANAQVIYEPVQYQHAGAPTVYYAGSDRGMLHYIEHVKCRNGFPSGITGMQYNSLRCSPARLQPGEFVYSDCLGYRNAYVYGYTVTDVRNEAYMSLPRYFTKRDLLDSAVVAADGSLVVPAVPQAHDTMMSHEQVKSATTQPAQPKPRAILILPKNKKPQAEPENVKQVALAK